MVDFIAVSWSNPNWIHGVNKFLNEYYCTTKLKIIIKFSSISIKQSGEANNKDHKGFNLVSWSNYTLSKIGREWSDTSVRTEWD